MLLSIRALALALSFCLIGVQMSEAAGVEESAPDRPTNVIFFIADGCGPASYTLAREYLRHKGIRERLAIDPWVVGSVSTFSSNSLITDSGAAATSYASGIKTYNTAIGVDSLRRPMWTLTQAAVEAGMSTGLVATSRITHATPAAFSSHVVHREMEDDIAAQQIVQGIDVIFGGGMRHFSPVASGGVRSDGRDLLYEARSGGYLVVNGREDFLEIERTPVLGLFAMDQMAYEIDRDPSIEPSLAEMTGKALELLSGSENAFFLMIEGSRIDHAAHGNDAAAHLHDILAFDDAVRVALEFAGRNGRTLVVGTSDHETGGLTLGSGRGGAYHWNPAALEGIDASHDVMVGMILTAGQDAEAVLAKHAGIADLNETERLLLTISVESGSPSHVAAAVGRTINSRVELGWTTNKHTAVDVPVFAFGPGAASFAGHQDNVDVGLGIARLLDFDLPRVRAVN